MFHKMKTLRHALATLLSAKNLKINLVLCKFVPVLSEFISSNQPSSKLDQTEPQPFDTTRVSITILK